MKDSGEIFPFKDDIREALGYILENIINADISHLNRLEKEYRTRIDTKPNDINMQFEKDHLDNLQNQLDKKIELLQKLRGLYVP